MVRYREGYKYQLVENCSVQTGLRPLTTAFVMFASIGPNGLLVIRRGYAWDGPSGPMPDVKSAMRGSLAHDALYQLMREGGLGHCWKDEADALLRDLCVEDGMSRGLADCVMEGVRLFGRRFTEPDRAKPVLEAGKG